MTKKEKKEYIKKHIDCLLVSIGILVITFLFGVFRFNGFIGRLIESVRDFGTSFAYYFCDIFEIDAEIPITVTEYPRIPFFEFMGGTAPVIPIPKELQVFLDNWDIYWQTFATWDNFAGYLSATAELLLNLSQILIFVLPIYLVFRIVFAKLLNKPNNNYNEDSKPLKKFKRFAEVIYIPVKRWVLRYCDFVREEKIFHIVWVIVWLCYFNVFTIVIEALAYYLFFVVSFDLTSLYKQAYKLLLDLWGMLMFFPLWCWVIIGVAVMSKISFGIGYNRLRHNEAKNCGVVNERGVVTIVYGEMGAGKTALITDMTLSENNIMRDNAFRIILECDMKFPSFPWIVFENELKRCFEHHTIFSISTCKKWIAKKRARFEKNPTKGRLFDYDYERYGMMFDDGLKLCNIWQVLEEYSCAYLIYTVESSYIVSSYSIRTDTIMNYIGNFPTYNKDFFARDSRLQDSFSRHSHILDFDMLRLGKVMLERNPYGKAFGFGVYVISEIDKERKNTIELQEVKRNSDDCNQKNDLFNTLLKMARHSCVVANRVFVKVFADLQRPSSLGADARELGEVIRIVDQSEKMPLLPFFSPYWWFEFAYLKLYDKFIDIYTTYRYYRGDNTLFIAAFKKLVAVMNGHYTRVNNTFGCSTMNLMLENGTLEGAKTERKWYKMSKKVYSDRYCTDCFSSIFDKRAEGNEVGLNDLPEYSGAAATWAELQSQHSFFQRDLETITEKQVDVEEERFIPPVPPVQTEEPEADFDMGFEVEQLLKKIK